MSRSSAKHDAKPSKKSSGFVIRTISTVVLLALFLLVMWGGHIPCALVLITFQALMVKELFTLARNADEDRTMPLFRTQQWYFFVVAIFYLYGRFIRHNLSLQGINLGLRATKVLAWLLRRHLMISYSMYIAGLLMFVLTLQQGQYLYQFKQFAWTHMIVFFTAVPTSFFMPLLFEGLMWFFMPVGLIIVNDIMAYIAGITVGRTPLIALSPKKTWEGFIGGAIGTIAASFGMAWCFAQFDWFRCPRNELSFGSLHCPRSSLYTPAEYSVKDFWEVLPDFIAADFQPVASLLPQAFADAAGALRWTCMPVQMHAMALALFASVVGPFGGFFASGFKRAFKLKDFGQSIPGHGGVTDRFDCQMLMAVFAYLYFHFYVARDHEDMEVLTALLEWRLELQIKVFKKLGEILGSEGLLDADAFRALASTLPDAPA